MYKILISILLLLLSFSSIAKKQPVASDYSKPIIVKSSAPSFTINLPANRTTGFSWFISSYNNKLIMPISAKYQAPSGSMPGAPGSSRWTFNVDDDAFTVPHILQITMIYARPWDLKGMTRKIITVVTN